MISNSEYIMLLLDDDLTDEEVADHRETYFGDTDPRLGSSYVFDMDDGNGNDLVTISPKHYFDTQGFVADQHNLCPVIPTDESETSNVLFFEECEGMWSWESFTNKQIGKKQIKKFLLDLGMTLVDTQVNNPYPLNTNDLKNKIDIWTTNLVGYPDLYDLSWKRTSKKKVKDFVSSDHIVHVNFKPMQSMSIVRQFVASTKTDKYQITILSDETDTHISDWYLEKI